MDDGDEWRVVRVKRRSKSHAHVGDARRKELFSRASRGTSNAFHALMENSPSEDDAEVVKEDTASPKRGGGGGKARSRRRDATPGTYGTDGSNSPRPERPKASDAREDGSDATASMDGGWTKRVNVAATAMLGRLFAPLLRASPAHDDTRDTREAGDEDQNETIPGNAAVVSEENDAVPRRDAADADDLDDDIADPAANRVPESPAAATSSGGSRPGATGSSPGPDRAVARAYNNAEHRAEPSPDPASAPPRVSSPPRDVGRRGAERDVSGAHSPDEKKEATLRFRAARVAPGDANGHCELVRAVSFVGDGAFVTGGWDGCVRRWAWSRDGRSVASTGPLAAHADRVEFVDAVHKFDDDVASYGSHSRALVVTGGRDCSLRVYDIKAASPAPLRKMYTYESVSAGCVDSKGSSIFVGARSGAASVFDVETGQKILAFLSATSAHELEVTAATSTSHHGVSFVTGGLDGVVKGWDTRVRDRCAFEISLHDTRGGGEKASRRIYSVAVDDEKIFVGAFAGSVFSFDARFLRKDDETSSREESGGRTIRNAPSSKHGGARRAPIAGLGIARLDARKDALFSTAAYFDESSSDDAGETARGCLRVFSLNDAFKEVCTLPNFGGGLVTSLGVREKSRAKGEGVEIVAGDVDGGVAAWRAVAPNADDEDEDEDAAASETKTETETDSETSSRATRAVRWDAASVRGVRFGFARDDSYASDDDSEGGEDGDDE